MSLRCQKSDADEFDTNFTVPVTTTAIDTKDKLVGFQADFAFDERAVTFQSAPTGKAGSPAAIGTFRGTCCLVQDQ